MIHYCCTNCLLPCTVCLVIITVCLVINSCCGIVRLWEMIERVGLVLKLRSYYSLYLGALYLSSCRKDKTPFGLV